MKAAGLLARGWRRGGRRWYVATALVLAATVALLVVVVGTLDGMQEATEERVADLYTGHLRATPTSEWGAIPPGLFTTDVEGTRMQLESQLILSRRGFLEAAIAERDQFELDAPGSDGRHAIAVGAVLGVTEAPRIGSHLVQGRMPVFQNGSVELVMSVDRFMRFLDDEERAQAGAMPDKVTMSALRLEITAATVAGNRSVAEGGDVIRRPAFVVGLYDTEVELLDSLTYVASIEDVRVLMGHRPDDPVSNVALAGPGGADALAGMAQKEGWGTATAKQFTDAHLGQLIRVIRSLGIFSAAVLFTLPAFLVAHGLNRQLQTHAREIAVARAIGVPRRAVLAGMGRLVAGLAGLGTAIGLVLALIGAVVAGVVLPRWFPMPVDFGFRPTSAVLVLLILTASILAATALAARQVLRARIVDHLRA